jgi:hypothetical protein
VEAEENLSYLRLRKDNLAIPREFYVETREEEAWYGSKHRHPLVPPLNLPRSAVNDLKQRYQIEKVSRESFESESESEIESMQDSI